MTTSRERWAGVDVGAAKGFDVAVIDRHGLLARPRRVVEVAEVVRWLQDRRPNVVAVDSPRSLAPDGHRSRECERELVRAGVCGIRYTPDAHALGANPAYYAWIANGLKLYAALLAAQPSAGWEVIECFPTATWTRLGGPRGNRPRARWSGEVLDAVGLGALPRRMSQDARDAIGAAVTARLYHDGEADAFGEIVVARDHVTRPRGVSSQMANRPRTARSKP